jgi:predicted site-specific integrase-resolvase
VKIEWIRPRELAEEIGVSVGTLANWRHQGIGPKYTKLSDSPNAPVRYKRSDVDTYLAGMEQGAA